MIGRYNVQVVTRNSIEVSRDWEAPVPSFPEAFRFWWKLGWITFGGTAAHIAIMHDELVVNKRWIRDGEFVHALSHCMILPGPEATQLAIYIGWKLHGRKGGIAAGSLFVLPSMFVLLALSLLYARFGRLPGIAAMISGLRPGIVALVILALVRVARRTLVAPLQWLIAGAAFAAMLGLHASIPSVILAAIVVGLFLGWRMPDRLRLTRKDENAPPPAGEKTWKQIFALWAEIALAGCLLWLGPLLMLYWLAPEFGLWKQLALFFTKTAFVTVGGSYTVIPYVAHTAVTSFHWLNSSQMIDGFSLAETTPGPLIIVVAFVGFMAGFNHFQSHSPLLMGTLALCVTTFYTFLPCFLFVFAGAPLVEKSYRNRSVEAVLRTITAVVVAAMLNLTVFLGRGALFPTDSVNRAGLDLFAVVWLLLSFILLFRYKMSVAALVSVSLVLGLGRWWLGL
jgi:chromate transporter